VHRELRNDRCPVHVRPRILELNQVSAAAFLQISVRTSHGYANGQRIPCAVQLLLKLMIEHEIKPETLA